MHPTCEIKKKDHCPLHNITGLKNRRPGPEKVMSDKALQRDVIWGTVDKAPRILHSVIGYGLLFKPKTKD